MRVRDFFRRGGEATPGINIRVDIPLAPGAVCVARVDAPGYPDAAYVEYFPPEFAHNALDTVTKIGQRILKEEYCNVSDNDSDA